MVRHNRSGYLLHLTLGIILFSALVLLIVLWILDYSTGCTRMPIHTDVILCAKGYTIIDWSSLA